MNFLHTEIGSAKDNQRSPVHNWYKFTAGFSYRFVEEIIDKENLKQIADAEIFDPFAGCGTTLVSSQKEGVKAVGNESQSFMYDIIKAKLNWSISKSNTKKYLSVINNYVNDTSFDLGNGHPLLASLYDSDTLRTLYLIRNSITTIRSEKYRLFFKLALSQTLHKVANHPIAVPYISRNKTLSNQKPVWDVFSDISYQMANDAGELSNEIYSKIYKHDSRKRNRHIKDGSCDICITSPPYLNNLDYGEVSKVHTHFFDITCSWNDITNKVRKKLVTGATTHFNQSDFDLEKFLDSNFAVENKKIVTMLLDKAKKIKNISKERSGKKDFDLLTLFYFQDMFMVLKEIRRVLKDTGKAYLILGDSAPYGVYIPTTDILGKIALNVGFHDYQIHKIRSRGTKWKSLKHRHNIELTENVLVIDNAKY